MDALARIGGWLIVPLIALLAAQWPLREMIHAYARTANDLAQLVFGFYVAVALGQATRARVHLRALIREPWPWVRLAMSVTVMLWSAVVFVLALAPAWRATLALEHFGEGLTPGYFLLRWALVLLAGLQCVVQFWQLLQTAAKPPTKDGLL